MGRTTKAKAGESASTALNKVHKVYGPTANIYADVLKVSPDANPSEIREAFFCLRYDIYQKLGDPPPSGGGQMLTSKERREVESRLDAITGAFHIVSDGGRRNAYDASLATSTMSSSTNNKGQGRSNSDTTAKTANSSSPTKLSPSKADTSSSSNDVSSSNDRGGLPIGIGQRRSVFRRRARRAAQAQSPRSSGKVSSGGGMNESRRAVAKPVFGGGLNARHRAVESADTIFEEVLGSTSKDSGNSKDNVDSSHLSRQRSKDTITGKDRDSPSVFGSLAGSSVRPDKDSIFGSVDRTESWTADFGSANNHENDGGDRATPPQSNGSIAGGSWHQDSVNDQPLPEGVNNMNAREQMLYKNQMYINQQKQRQQQQQHMQQQQQQGSHNGLIGRTPSRLGSKYDTSERSDKYTDIADKYAVDVDENEDVPPEDLVSPTGVDGFDDSNNAGWSRNKGGNRSADRPPPATTKSKAMGDASAREAPATNERAPPGGARAEEPKRENAAYGTTYDNESRTQGDDEDDARTYGDETATTYDGADARTYDDEDETATRASSAYGDEDTRTYDGDDATTQMEDSTVGESTYASEFGDDDTFATNNSGKSGGGRYSPGHKKGKKPEPILRMGGNGVKRNDSDTTGRRVTIHSHRGRGEDSDDFSLFENASCPTIPTFKSIQEEINGTYKDFTSALHQVSNAFVINPDDIDRIADKIRDAKIELGENYHKQVKERSGQTKALPAK